MERTLLVLGASSECGMSIIRKVHRNYTQIYAHYAHHSEELSALQKEIGEKILLIEDDFSSESCGSAVLEAIKEKGIWPDHVIHLPAPAYQNYKFVKSGWEPFEVGIHVSLRSCIVILQSVIAKMVKDKRAGKILFMLSSYVNNIPPRFTSPYVTVKYALLGLMKELSAEYADKGIMVNGISPGMMETKFLNNIPDLIIEQNASKSPFGKNLCVEEVVPVFEFMLSEGANRITGQNIIVSGGA